MYKVKLNDVRINKIEREFRKNIFIDPAYDYNPSHKYKFFYIDMGDKLERCGITRLSLGTAVRGGFNQYEYKYDYDKVDLKCYSLGSGCFSIENVLFTQRNIEDQAYEPLILYKSKNEDNYSVIKYGYVYNPEEIGDIIVVSHEVVKAGDNFHSYKILVHKNGVIEHSFYNVHSYDYLYNIHKLIICCTRNDREREPFDFYIFDYKTGKGKFLGKYHDFHINSRQWVDAGGHPRGGKIQKILKDIEITKREILDKDNIYFYFSVDNSVGCHVLMEFMKTADLLERIENLFTFDVTENYVAGFNRARLKDIQFALYIMSKYNIAGLKLFGYEIAEIIKIISFDSAIYKYYARNVLSKNFDSIKRIYDYLYKKYNFSNDEEIIKFLALEFGIMSVDDSISKRDFYFKIKPVWDNMKWDFYGYGRLIKYFSTLEENVLIEYELSIEDLYLKALLNDENKVRWKSEFALFKLIRLHFPDAIYQYRSPWLNQQSLDIFLANERIAIEYQGEQHYKPIDLFGGKKGLRETQERDMIKKRLCVENGVTLIEWKYDIAINTINLAKVFINYNIDIPLDESDKIL
ncbi:MAG: hypothetical protein GX992_00580 [Clostridium sp.]|nr:hypothetical protein [Clostridium sp.]